MFIYNYLRIRECALFLKCVHCVQGSSQLLKSWLTIWDGIILISANLYIDFDTRLLEVIGFSVKERTSLASVVE